MEPNADGTLEGTIGGVLLDPGIGRYVYFMASVSRAVMQQLLAQSENPICQVELLAVLSAFVLWRRFLIDKPVIAWVDNEASRSALVKGCSPQVHVAAILADVTRIETSAG